MSDHVLGKSVIVTGAGNGFGRLIACALAQRKAFVTCVDIDPESVANTVELAGEAHAHAVVADVSDAKAMQSAVNKAIQVYGRVDVLVNNAGIMPLALFADHASALDQWHRAIDINIKGTINGIAAVYDAMTEQGHGQVVNISSIYGNHPTYGAGVYGATKSAINFISESLRVETRGAIKVSIIKPTGVSDTGLGQSVVNREGVRGILGHNAEDYLSLREARVSGQLAAEKSDPESPAYLMLEPGHIADAVVHVINQPDGVSIGDITVRATGEHFIL